MVATARAIGQTLQRGGMDWHDLVALVSGKGKRQAAPAFTFASLAPRTARKQIALLAGQPTMTLMDRVRIDHLCLWLYGQPVSVRLPADQTKWLHGLRQKDFG